MALSIRTIFLNKDRLILARGDGWTVLDRKTKLAVRPTVRRICPYRDEEDEDQKMVKGLVFRPLFDGTVLMAAYWLTTLRKGASGASW